MKKVLQKILLIVFTIFIMYLFRQVYAATYNIVPSNTNVKVGEKISVSVSLNAGGWNVLVDAGGLPCSDLTGLVGNTDKTSNVDASKTYVFIPDKAGNYTISLNGTITDYETEEKIRINKTIPITVTANTQEQQQQNQPTQQPAQQPEQQQELQFTNMSETKYTKSVINLRSQPTTSSQSYGELATGTEVKILAKSTGKRDNFYWFKVTANGKTGYIADMNNLIDTKPTEEEKNNEDDNKKEKSTNKALKDIVIENHKISPEFDPETTKYTVEVTKDVEKLEITPILADDKAKYDITGNDNFKLGNNIVKITVTAEDGTNRIYTLTVTKTNKDGSDNPLENMLKLSKLQIKDIKLDPEFKPETTTYSILVADPSSIKISDITAVAEDEDVEVTIAETDADANGNRVVTIMLENKDGDKSGVYQVTIKKGVSAISELQRNKNNRIYFILGGIIAILAIAIIVVIVLLKKTSDDEEDLDDINDADELSDDYDYSLKREIDKAKSESAPEFDDIIEDSNVKSQILSNQNSFNAPEDEDNTDAGVSEETKRYSFDDEENDDDFQVKGKKKGKHF